MESSASLQAVEALLMALEECRDQVAGDIADGLNRGGQLREAARAIGDSSSGSWLGWHSRMYYGDYEEPSVNESWDPEWGSIHGFSDRWGERSQADVQQAVEQRAGITLGDLAAIADRVREATEPLQQELLTVLSPICDLGGLDKEADLLGKIEAIDWIVPPGNFIHALAPRQAMSRDSTAVSQGLQAPLHLNVEAAIVSNTTTLAKSHEFFNDGIRLVRQVRTKLQATPARELVAAAAAGEPPDVRLERELRRRSLALFALLAAAVVGIAVLLVLRDVVDDRLARAALVVGAAVVVAGLYALLVDRGHARRALAAAAAVGGAIAAVDQLLGHFG